MDKLFNELVEKRAAMALGVFMSPPSDWAGFQKRLGQFIELNELIESLKEAMRGRESDE